jgi:hypothetical protein
MGEWIFAGILYRRIQKVLSNFNGAIKENATLHGRIREIGLNEEGNHAPQGIMQMIVNEN